MSENEVLGVFRDEDYAFVSDCIKRCEWRWAKTMPTIPHSYIVRDKCRLSEEEFLRFVDLQLKFGIRQRWGKYNNPYLHIDGYKYWSCTNASGKVIIMNRQKLFDEYNAIAPMYESLISNEEYQKEKETIRQMLTLLGCGSVVDIGCGTGTLLDMFVIPVGMYHGVDPSKLMLSELQKKYPEHKAYLIPKAYEECKWDRKFDIAIGLFGSPSYLMKEYIPNIRTICTNFFLMFYKPGYEPATYQTSNGKMHPFPYTLNDVKRMLGCNVYDWKNYMIATTVSL